MWSWTGHICKYQSTNQVKFSMAAIKKYLKSFNTFKCFYDIYVFQYSAKIFQAFYIEKSHSFYNTLGGRTKLYSPSWNRCQWWGFFKLSIRVVAVKKIIWQLFEVWFIYTLTVCSLNYSKLICILSVNFLYNFLEFLMNVFYIFFV